MNDKQRAIYKACSDGDDGRVKELLDEDPSLISTRNQVFTLMSTACANVQGKVIEFLLGRGFTVDERDGQRMTPLHQVLREVSRSSLRSFEDFDADDAYNAVEMLLERGANPNALADGEPPWYSFVEVAGCNVNARTLKLLFEFGMDANVMVKGKTLIRSICSPFCKAELLKLCLENGSDVNEFSNEEGTLLHTMLRDVDNCLELPRVDNFLESVQTLFDYGFTGLNRTFEGRSILGEAAFFCNIEFIRFLLKKGARADLGDSLYFLAYESPRDVWKKRMIAHILIENGARLNPCDHIGRDCLKALTSPREDPVFIRAARSIIHLLFRENAVALSPAVNYQRWLGIPSHRILQQPNSEAIRFLYELGYVVDEVEELPDDEKPDYALNRTLSLQSLCRQKLRMSLGSPMSKKVKHLELPEAMKDFVSMKEIEADLPLE